jgi:TolB protein
MHYIKVQKLTGETMLKKILILLAIICNSAYALDLELTQGVNSALPIGIQSFGENEDAIALKEVISHDFKFSGQFREISEPYGASIGTQALPLWHKSGADDVIVGNVSSVGGNKIAVSIELFDTVSSNKPLLQNKFTVTRPEIRALGHHISDLIYQKLTGDRGVFSTKIAYVMVKRDEMGSRYTLEIADMDGYGPQSLLVSPEPIMSPSWSPDGRQIAYVSFEKRKQQIYIVSVETGQRRLITDFSGINSAPSWSPDGRQLAVVLSKGGSPKIYTVNLSNGNITQVTFGSSIDTEPRFTPDGKSIIFTSGRSGNPQIYKLALTNGKIDRLTYDGNYNARPSYTPDQKHLIYFHRDEGLFHIAVQDVRAGTAISVTTAELDESPSVSPNGKLILYATRENNKGVLGMVSIDGRIHLRLPSRDADVQEPAWSPYF